MQQLESQTITVPESHAGRRLDKFLRSQLKGVPATMLFRLMRKGAIRVNGRKCKQDDRISSGDEISLPALEIPDRGQRGPARGSRPGPRSSRRDPAVERLSQCLSRRIIFEDANLLILNKPGGVAVHVGSGVKAGVIEALRMLRPDTPDLELAHRLDRETSGLLMVAKTNKMLRYLQEMLRDREHEIRRYYLAVVGGVLKKEGKEPRTLDAPLRRTGVATVVDRRAGQRAETHVWVKKPWGPAKTLVEAQLLTGRKHQIRVHLQDLGHPIVGDSRYGAVRGRRGGDGNGMARREPRGGAVRGGGARRGGGDRGRRDSGVPSMMLHASRLVVPMPDGSELDVQAPIPAEWQKR